jgi:hypothetical protein
LEKFVFRRGYWKPEDLQLKNKHSIRGLQFWNGIRDEGFKLGREFWINELGKGNYLLPIGGNDAHGDLNSMTAVDLPLISLKHTRAHTFGNVRTVIKIDERRETRDESGSTTMCHPEQSEGSSKVSLTLATINTAFTADNCYITDGPALWWERDNNGITFHARSNKETGGGFRYVRIYGRRIQNNGKFAPEEEVMIGSQVATPDHADIPVATLGFAYVRAECETATGKFALTSAAQLL